MGRSFNGTSDKGVSSLDLSSYSTITCAFWMWVNAFSGTTRYGVAYAAPQTTGSGFFVQAYNTTGGIVSPTCGMFVATSHLWYDKFAAPVAASWHHYCYIGTRATPVNAMYLDGAVATLTTVTHTAATYGNYGVNKMIETGSSNGALFLAGRLAEITVWGGVTLTASEAKALSLGANPFVVHPDGIVFYAPLFGADSPEPDYSGAQKNVTLTGTAYTAPPGAILKAGGVVL